MATRIQYVLIDNDKAAGVADYGWVDLTGMEVNGSVIIEGPDANNTFDLRVSNKPGNLGGPGGPTATEIGVILGSTINTAAIIPLTPSTRWLKLRRLSSNGGAVSAFVYGVRSNQG